MSHVGGMSRMITYSRVISQMILSQIEYASVAGAAECARGARAVSQLWMRVLQAHFLNMDSVMHMINSCCTNNVAGAAECTSAERAWQCHDTSGSLAITGVCHDSLMCVPWHIHDCAMNRLWTCDASAQLARLRSQLRVCHDSWMRVPLLIDVGAMTCWRVCHELCENVWTPQHNWPTCNHRGVCHDSFYVYAIPHWRVRHDT